MIRRVVMLRYLTKPYAYPATPYEKIISNPDKRLNVKLVVLIIFLVSSHTYDHSHKHRCLYINVSSSYRCSNSHGVVAT